MLQRVGAIVNLERQYAVTFERDFVTFVLKERFSHFFYSNNLSTLSFRET